MKWRFALRFLLAFAVLVPLWWRLDIPARYRAATLATAQVVSPLVHGWWLDYDEPGMTDPVVFRRESVKLPMLLSVPLLSMSVMPFLSLIAATPGLGWRHSAIAALVGVATFFVLHVGIVVSYPALLNNPSFVKDMLGIFSGLLAFVVGPLGLWFVLTYHALRDVWQLTPQVGETGDSRQPS